MLSTFEFWLELKTRCKGKTLLALRTNFLFSVQYKADSKQNMFFFSTKNLNGCKHSNFFKLPELDKIPLKPFQILRPLRKRPD